MKKILVIENDRNLLKNTRQVLEREQFNVLTANSGKEGLAKPVKTSDLIRAVRKKLKQQQTGLKISSLAELKTYMLTGEKLEFKRGFEIFKEGRKTNFIYLLKSGLIKTHRMDTYGKQLITGLYKPKDIFGFYTFKKPLYYPETATALEKSVLYRISRREFQAVLVHSPLLSIELAQMLSDNILQLKNNLLEMAYSSVLKKTTNTILEFSRLMPEYSEKSIKISRTDLASFAGISTESFIRSLSCLKKQGLIDIQGRDIKILNLKELKNIR